MLGRILVAGGAASLLLCAVPAMAGRTAIDGYTDADGNFHPVRVTLGGYCDLNGQDCSSPVTLSYQGTPYSVTLGGSTFDSFYVQGNGLLTFGSSVDFGSPDDTLSFYSRIVNDGVDPSITAYGLSLVSVGQNNAIDPQSFGDSRPFYQSASYGIDANGSIFAEFFTCVTPGVACHQSVQRLTLTPRATGFAATVTGATFGSDRGYVIDGQFFGGGSSFFIPATFTGVSLSVPEPATWALMIAGFCLTGAASRRRIKRATATAA